MGDRRRERHGRWVDDERVQLVVRRPTMRADLGHERHVALGRADSVDDEIARALHRYQVAEALDDPREIVASAKRPDPELVETVALAAPAADGPVGRAGQHEADAAAPCYLVGEPRKAIVDPLDADRRSALQEVDERVRPGGHDADPVVLTDGAHPAEHPGEVALEIVHEPLEEP